MMVFILILCTFVGVASIPVILGAGMRLALRGVAGKLVAMLSACLLAVGMVYVRESGNFGDHVSDPVLLLGLGRGAVGAEYVVAGVRTFVHVLVPFFFARLGVGLVDSWRSRLGGSGRVGG